MFKEINSVALISTILGAQKFPAVLYLNAEASRMSLQIWWEKEETNVSFVAELSPLAEPKTINEPGENEETSRFENIVDFCWFFFLLSIEKS